MEIPMIEGLISRTRGSACLLKRNANGAVSSTKQRTTSEDAVFNPSALNPSRISQTPIPANDAKLFCLSKNGSLREFSVGVEQLALTSASDRVTPLVEARPRLRSRLSTGTPRFSRKDLNKGKARYGPPTSRLHPGGKIRRTGPKVKISDALSALRMFSRYARSTG